MASIRHPWPSLFLLFSSFLFFPSSFSSPSPLPSSPQRRLLQTPSSPPPLAQNLETFFPSISSPAFTNSPPLPPPPPPAPPNSATQSPTPQTSKSSHGDVTKAVLATAATSFAISGIVFFLFLRFSDRRRRHRPPPPAKTLFRPNAQGPLKGLVVDENGLDVLYWRRLDDDGDAGGGGGVVVKRCELCSRSMRSPGNFDDADLIERNDASFQEIPLMPSNSVNSSARITPDSRIPLRSFSISQSAVSIETVARPSIPRAPPRPTPSPPKSPRAVPPPTPPPPPPPPAPPVPPPPPPPKKLSAPAPSAPPPPPPRPPLAAGRGPAAAPPPPPPGGAGPSPRPPMPARSTSGKAHPKLKPLHWDKLTPVNTEHSMVWDKITGGSFRVDDELMESLFGYVATNRKVPGGKKNTPDTTSPSTSTGSSAQICLLDPRKSQNIAIILRTLDISRQDILDSLLDGRALTSDALEKLSRTVPSKEEEAKILDFSGNPSKLSDAESFLFHLYRSVPAPFVRLDAMLFKSNYEPEILHVKQSLQTLELACKEMKTRGTFLKLLEAILKAGNRMNAGTARGNAQAFNLKALCKLSDVKSTDGKTTLLRFVVEEVVRSEGKRCVINRNHSMRRTNSTSGSSQTDPAGREEREKEYMMLGLPIVGGLSVEFANVKKAAGIDYDALLGTCSSLGERIKEIRHFLGSCRGDGFVKEMKGFLETAEEEVRIVREEQGKVVELVKRTTEYYQVGATMEKGSDPLQLFVIVRDFLGMVDQVCVNITRNLQKRKQMVGVGESRNSTVSRRATAAARFPNLPVHFMSDNSKSGSDSDEDRF